MQERLARTETIIPVLARRCAEEAERAGREREAAIAAEIDGHVRRAEELRAQAVQEEQAAEEGGEWLAAIEAENVAAVAEFLPDFDAVRAGRASSARAQRTEQVSWYARHAATEPETWPVGLRAEITAAIVRLDEQRERDREREREASDRSLRDLDMSEHSREWIRSGRPVNG